MTNTIFTDQLTCQICGGTFNALEGYIARHGHKRIKGRNGAKGYMTNGCAGSRQRPFENSRDQLGKMLEVYERLVIEAEMEADNFLDLEDKERAREGGFLINGFEINETDLDRREIDVVTDDVTQEEVDSWKEDIQHHLFLVDIHGYEYGQMTWDEFWDHMHNRAKRHLEKMRANLESQTKRFKEWTQTISDEDWDHNREIIVGEKRTNATLEGWDNRETRVRREPVKVAASKPKREPKPKLVANSSKHHRPMMLRQFGAIVARFADHPSGTGVIECIPCAGGWTVIDHHPDWATLEKMFGEALETA